jgi:hypothetical protein
VLATTPPPSPRSTPTHPLTTRSFENMGMAVIRLELPWEGVRGAGRGRSSHRAGGGGGGAHLG